MLSLPLSHQFWVAIPASSDTMKSEGETDEAVLNKSSLCFKKPVLQKSKKNWDLHQNGLDS
jgi:hypothetical protein